MNRADIIQMAMEADMFDERDDLDQQTFAEIIASVERFYHLAVAAEREACAKVCEDYGTHNITVTCAAAIRARGTP